MNIDPVYLGYLAAFGTTASFLPQVIHTLRTRDTRSISLGMYALFTFGVGMWLIYGFLENDLPLIVANAITLCLASTILGIKIKHRLNQ